MLVLILPFLFSGGYNMVIIVRIQWLMIGFSKPSVIQIKVRR